MDILTRLLFEQPYLQGTLMGVALLVSLAGWWWARYEPANAKRWGLATAILAILAVAGQITASLVTTDREQIETMFQQIAVAVEDADVPAILAMTDEGVVARGFDQDQRFNKEQFSQWLEGLFRRVRIRTPRIQKLQITFDGRDAATAVVSGVATIETAGYKHIATAAYKFEFDRIAGQWKIVSLEPQETVGKLPL